MDVNDYAGDPLDRVTKLLSVLSDQKPAPRVKNVTATTDNGSIPHRGPGPIRD